MADDIYRVRLAPDWNDEGLDYFEYDPVIHDHYGVVGTTPPLLTLELTGMYTDLMYHCKRGKPITIADFCERGGTRSRKRLTEMLSHLQAVELIACEDLDDVPADRPLQLRMIDPYSAEALKTKRAELWERIKDSPVIPKHWKRRDV